MQSCGFCGRGLPDDAQFCPQCGRPIQEPTDALTAAAQTQPEETAGTPDPVLPAHAEEEATETVKLGPLEAKQLAVLHKMMRANSTSAQATQDHDDDLPPPPVPFVPDSSQGVAPVVQSLPQMNIAPQVPSLFTAPAGASASTGWWAGMSALMKTVTVAVLGLVILGAAAGVAWRFFPLVGTAPTPAHAGTPAVNIAQTQTAVVQTRGNSSISVRDNQLWLTTNNQALPLTSFSYAVPEGFNTPPTIYWSMPAWSPDNKYLAFIMTNMGAGLGGAGCPAPNYDYGALYLFDPASKQLLQITDQGSIPMALNASIGRQAVWRAFFWEDATHILLIPNYDARDAPGDKLSLYRYDIEDHTVSTVFPLTRQELLGASATGEFNLLNYHYRNGQFYYQVAENVGQDTAQLAIYSHALTTGSQPKKVATVSEPLPWCKATDDLAKSVRYISPGWNISPDGKYLAFQQVSGVGEQSKSSVRVLELATGQQHDLFTQLPQKAQATDLDLVWAPNNRSLLASYSSYEEEQASYYVTSLEKPAEFQTHTHAAPRDDGEFCYPGSWRPDSHEIAFTCKKSLNRWSAYSFVPGSQDERLLAENTSIYTWG